MRLKVLKFASEKLFEIGFSLILCSKNLIVDLGFISLLQGRFQVRRHQALDRRPRAQRHPPRLGALLDPA